MTRDALSLFLAPTTLGDQTCRRRQDYSFIPFSFLTVTAMAASSEITVKAAEDTVKDLAEKDADSVDSDIRYMAYGARLRTALRAGTRYIAYVHLCLFWVSFIQ